MCYLLYDYFLLTQGHPCWDGVQESYNAGQGPGRAGCFTGCGTIWGQGVQVALERFVRLDHLGLDALTKSRRRILREHQGLALEQSVVHLKSVGTDRLGREGGVRGFRGKFYPCCTFETFRPKVLAVRGVKFQDQLKGPQD